MKPCKSCQWRSYEKLLIVCGTVVFTICIVLHSHSCVPHKSQVSSLEDFQVCHRYKIQCSSSHSCSIIVNELYSSMHLNARGLCLSWCEMQKTNKQTNKQTNKNNSTAIQINEHTYFIGYHKRVSFVCLKLVESTEAERNICCTHCSAHFSIIADEVTERRCNKIWSTVFHALHTVNYQVVELHLYYFCIQTDLWETGNSGLQYVT